MQLEVVGMQAMGRLKPDHQVVLVLVCIDGMSYKKPLVLGLPIGTIMSRLSRARLELSRHLEDGGDLASNVEAGDSA
ncbi:MAG: hypothetical protein R3D67_17760 [Hyphomicrobiaceae bacterium]